MYRDPNAWYHVVLAVDTTIVSPASDRVKLYVNSNLEPLTGPYSSGAYTDVATFPSENYQTQLAQSSGTTEISPTTGFANGEWEGHMSQFYFIDGQALGPESFGFTDPLTNTWRPKKFSGSFTQSAINDGTSINGCYQSGQYAKNYGGQGAHHIGFGWVDKNQNGIWKLNFFIESCLESSGSPIKKNFEVNY